MRRLIHKSDGREASLLTVDCEIRRMFGAPHSSDRFFADWIKLIQYHPVVSLDSEIKRLKIEVEYATNPNARNEAILHLQIARYINERYSIK